MVWKFFPFPNFNSCTVEIWKWISNFIRMLLSMWVKSRRCGCLVTWFCYHLIAKPGNKTASPKWPDPSDYLSMLVKGIPDIRTKSTLQVLWNLSSHFECCLIKEDRDGLMQQQCNCALAMELQPYCIKPLIWSSILTVWTAWQPFSKQHFQVPENVLILIKMHSWLFPKVKLTVSHHWSR